MLPFTFGDSHGRKGAGPFSCRHSREEGLVFLSHRRYKVAWRKKKKIIYFLEIGNYLSSAENNGLAW